MACRRSGVRIPLSSTLRSSRFSGACFHVASDILVRAWRVLGVPVMVAFRVGLVALRWSVDGLRACCRGLRAVLGVPVTGAVPGCGACRLGRPCGGGERG